MKIAKWITAIVLSASLGFAAQAQEETPVDMKDLPPEAQTTIKEKVGSDQILRIAKERRNGQECYDPVVNRTGRKWRSGWIPMESLLILIPKKASRRKRPRNINCSASG